MSLLFYRVAVPKWTAGLNRYPARTTVLNRYPAKTIGVYVVLRSRCLSFTWRHA